MNLTWDISKADDTKIASGGRIKCYSLEMHVIIVKTNRCERKYKQIKLHQPGNPFPHTSNLQRTIYITSRQNTEQSLWLKERLLNKDEN